MLTFDGIRAPRPGMPRRFHSTRVYSLVGTSAMRGGSTAGASSVGLFLSRARISAAPPGRAAPPLWHLLLVSGSPASARRGPGSAPPTRVAGRELPQ